MWTYMMAASRGERANSMMSSRRRNESESPKYGYSNRPMYRTQRLNTTASSASYPYAGAHYDNSSGGAAMTTSGLPSASSAQMLRLPHDESSHPPYYSSTAGVDEEEGASLFAPLTPSATMTAFEKDTSIFGCKDTTARMVRKQLIANNVGATTEPGGALVRMPSHESVGDDDACGRTPGRRAFALQQRQSKSHDDELDDDDDGDADDDDDEVEADDNEIDEAGEVDYLESAMENGKRVAQCEAFALRLGSYKLRISQCGLFVVDMRLFFQMFSAVVSWTLVLVQYHMVINVLKQHVALTKHKGE